MLLLQAVHTFFEGAETREGGGSLKIWSEFQQIGQVFFLL